MVRREAGGGVSWGLAGCKPQAIRILSALGEACFRPRFVAAPTGAKGADIKAMESATTALGALFGVSRQLEEPEWQLKALDVLLICRFNLLSENIFTRPRLGAINVHSSLLPRYRGVHPVSWALIEDAGETGVTLHRIDTGIDTGTILGQAAVAIEDRHDLWSLTDDIDRASADLAVRLFNEIAATGALPAGRPQAGAGSYARRRKPEDSHVEWRSPRAVFNLVRALPAPLPPAFALGPEDKPIAILRCSPQEAPADGAAPGTVLGATGQGETLVQCADGRAARVVFAVALPPGVRLR